MEGTRYESQIVVSPEQARNPGWHNFVYTYLLI
jgi:hypothetical protein